MNKQAPCWEGYVQRGMKPGEGGRPVPNCVPATSKVYDGCGCETCKQMDVSCESCPNCGGEVNKDDSVSVGQMAPWSGSAFSFKE